MGCGMGKQKTDKGNSQTRGIIQYRGSLKSCNYSCSYCPFSKHPMSDKELGKDKTQWFAFVSSLHEIAARFHICALQVVPYGEALIHPWYWEGLGDLCGISEIEAVGAQTNFSFSLPEALKHFEHTGGKREKLRLWATFHPEMVSVADFVGKCQKVLDEGIIFCVGAVGVPENLTLLQNLREELPREIYLWINKMDGLNRPYSKKEKEGFTVIDPYFAYQLNPVLSDVSQCRGRLFVEGDGKLRTCNISRNWQMAWEELCQAASFPEPECGRRVCSCYLAYGGRADFAYRDVFGDYSVFRVPVEK